MGKKLVRGEEDIRKSMILPSENDIRGIVTKRLRKNRVMVRARADSRGCAGSGGR